MILKKGLVIPGPFFLLCDTLYRKSDQVRIGAQQPSQLLKDSEYLTILSNFTKQEKSIFCIFQAYREATGNQRPQSSGFPGVEKDGRAEEAPDYRKRVKGGENS